MPWRTCQPNLNFLWSSSLELQAYVGRADGCTAWVGRADNNWCSSMLIYCGVGAHWLNAAQCLWCTISSPLVDSTRVCWVFLSLHMLTFSPTLLTNNIVRMLNLWSRGHGFDSQHITTVSNLFTHTHMSMAPSSIICWQLRGSDAALWLES